jgi:hypothetical protein
MRILFFLLLISNVCFGQFTNIFGKYDYKDSARFSNYVRLSKKFDYATNIGASFTARSLTDKGYVDSSIAANIGNIPISTWQQTLDAINGSILTHDNLIKAPGFNFYMDSLKRLSFMNYATEVNQDDPTVKIKNNVLLSDDANEGVQTTSQIISSGSLIYASNINTAPSFIGLQSSNELDNKLSNIYILPEYIQLFSDNYIKLNADSAVFAGSISVGDSSRQLATTQFVKQQIASSPSGTVTSVSVVNTNGFNGTVANAATTPAITIQTTVNGLVKGNGTAISAAIANTDYATPAYADAKVADAINNGVTTIAPSQNAVFDALALKLNITDTAAMLAPYLLEAELPVYTAGNMLTKTGNVFKAGGNVTEHTTFLGDGTKDVLFDNVQSFGVASSSISMGSGGGANYLYGDWEVDELLRANSELQVDGSAIFNGTGALAKLFNYTTNIGASFTARSLTDKGYVDSVDALKLNIADAYNDEKAQDAIGSIVDATLVYNDGLPSLGRAAIDGDIAISAGSNTAAITAGVIVNADINGTAAIDATKIADGTVTSSEFQYINSLTSNAQTQFNNKVTKGGDAGALLIGTSTSDNLELMAGNNTKWRISPNGGLLRGITSSSFGLHLGGTGFGSAIVLGDTFALETPYIMGRENGGTDTDQWEFYAQKGIFLRTGSLATSAGITIQQDNDVIIGGETQVAGAELTVIGDEDVSGNLNVQGNGTFGSFVKYKTSVTPSTPANGTEVNVYFKSNKIIFQYNDGGTVRYKYLSLTGTGVTWVHTTTAP